MNRKIAAVAFVGAALLGACAAPAVDEKGQPIATQSRVCDQELTGTHFKRCARDSTVESVSREDLDMARMRTTTVTKEPGQRIGR